MKWFRSARHIFVAISLTGIASALAYSAWLVKNIDASVVRIRASGAPVSMADLEKSGRIPNDRNAALVYMRAFKLFSGKHLSKRMSEALNDLAAGKGYAQAKELVVGYDSAISIAANASKMPECRYPIDWSKGPLNVESPYYAPALSLVKLLSLRAMLAAGEGDAEESIRCNALAFKVAESLKSEPVLIGFLVRKESLSISSRGLRVTLQRVSINEREARNAYELLGKIDLNAGFRTALLGERAMGIEEDELLRRKARPCSAANPVGAWLLGLQGCLDERACLDGMQKQIDLSNVPCRLIRIRRLDLHPESENGLLFCPVMMPMFRHARVWRDTSIAEIDGDRILLALMAYKDRYHAYPESLDELHRKLGWELPKDVFSGEGFRYRRVGKGFLLSSIGPNLKDDAGMESELRYIRIKGDIVWKWDH